MSDFTDAVKQAMRSELEFSFSLSDGKLNIIENCDNLSNYSINAINDLSRFKFYKEFVFSSDMKKYKDKITLKNI